MTRGCVRASRAERVVGRGAVRVVRAITIPCNSVKARGTIGDSE